LAFAQRVLVTYRLVLLDFDGTIADSFDWFIGVFDQVADRYGYRRLVPDDRERLRGLEARAILRALGIPLWKVPRIARHMRALAARDIAAIRLFPGAAEMMAALHGGGIELAVVSSNDEENVRRVLGPAAALVARFACGASLFGKAVKIRALLRAARTDARATLLVGDEARDVAAARAAGIDSAAVAWGYTDAAFLRSLAPTLFFERMEEIAAALVTSAP
jgi:phosphoglycolate phosphatase